MDTTSPHVLAGLAPATQGNRDDGRDGAKVLRQHHGQQEKRQRGTRLMTHPGFTAELNQPNVYTDKLIAYLRRAGFDVERLPHKTLIRIRYDEAKTFAELKRTLRSLLRSRTSSVYLLSRKTGREWIMKAGGNRSGQLVKY
jgi:hypothetical protein